MFKRFAALLACLAFVFCLLPSAAPAENEEPLTILVGWYETPFNHLDAHNRRTGYAYEYQRKIAAYTGWKYEYIDGNWSELLEKAEAGKIDLMSDVSWTKDRESYLSYANIPMGTELYCLYVSPENTQVSVENPATLKGKKVGVTKRSVQRGLFITWADGQSLHVSEQMDSSSVADDILLIDMECSEEESLNLLMRGELDAFVTLDTYSDPNRAVPLWKIGASDFYFVVSKKSPHHDQLLAGLNAAMSRIQDENKHYNEQLSEKYFREPGTNRYLTADEKAWLNGHGAIRVGYQDNYLAFCAADPDTGELTGALKDYLAYASDVLDDVHLEFTAVRYPTAAAAMEALQNGEVDCMFPANLTDYDGEQAGVVMSPPLMRTEMDAVVREEDKADFLRRSTVRVGVNRGNPNYEIFLQDHFPSWTSVVYDNTPACLDAVAARSADCIIISNYRFGDIARQCERLHLTTVYTGVDMDYCLAVKEGNTALYSILSKAITMVPDATVNAALTYYSSESTKVGFWDYVADHLAVILGAVSILLLITILLLYRKLRMRTKLADRKSGISSGNFSHS